MQRLTTIVLLCLLPLACRKPVERKVASDVQPLLDSLERVDAAQKAGDEQAWRALVHPKYAAMMANRLRISGQTLKEVASGNPPLVAALFPDPPAVKRQTDGDWARLYWAGDDDTSMALFARHEEQWRFVAAASLANSELPSAREFAWPPDERMLWLDPVRLVLSADRTEVAAGEPVLLTFTVTNTGTRPLTAPQLGRFFRTLSYRVGDRRLRAEPPGQAADAPDPLAPGESWTVARGIALTLDAPGEYPVEWFEAEYASEPLLITVR